MITTSITVEADIIRAYKELLPRVPRLAQQAFPGEIRRVTRPMLAELQEQPGPVKYPIRWKSEKQRRAYFATDGFGHGIPYRRTGQLSAGWQVDYSNAPFGGDVMVSNPAPAARFVYGPDQQPFHADTGWPLVAPIVQRYEDLVGDALINTWFSIVDFEGL